MLFIFDCDGTLVDSEHLNNNALSELLIEAGYTQYTAELCTEVFIGQALESCFDILQEREGILTFDRKEMQDAYIQRNLDNMDRDLKIDPNTVETLTHYQNLGFKMVVASNGELPVVRASIKAAGLEQFFPEDMIFTKEMVSHPKPAPDLFLFAIRKTQTASEPCFVIEDSVAGVIAAKNAVLPVIGITAFSPNPREMRIKLIEAGADYVIENIKDLQNIANHPQQKKHEVRSYFVKAANK